MDWCCTYKSNGTYANHSMFNGVRVMDTSFMSLEGKLGDAEFSDCPLNMLERGKHDSKEAWESIFRCLMSNTV